MDKLKNYLLPTACLVILVGALTLIGGPLVQQGQAVPPDRDVTVVNTSTNPVPVVVQNGNTNGTISELVVFVTANVDGGTRVDLFTVPLGQRLVITDVIVAAFGRTAENTRIIRDGVVISSFNVSSSTNDTYEHSYVSGIVFRAGETLGIIGGAGATTNWELRGFSETLPPS
jgi:hypothetical protein